jgi:Holliday junction resolvase-like predicted endonuclease
VNRGERAAARHYRLRGYRILGANVHAGGYEIDLIARRGTRLVFVEVKERSRETYGSRPIPRRPPSRSASRLRRSPVAAWSASNSRTTRAGGNGGNARSVRL